MATRNKNPHSNLPIHAVRRSDNTIPKVVLGKSSERVTNANSHGTYMGLGLGRTCNRPGAYDFMDCKSRGYI